ncbi:hypothetical protein CR203_10070 [Salipaludibacillus neizhouensis]|uniref:Major facilitator superfamily (MFS) profile domain-containing protein n=1 Tax=Salipaludibacillus neizhouensis TaxID=885475 RepID=A0A3A9K3M8_9BACI|nr:MFS transporter [Salipaludibacillus neizhouensis]RKL67684.1 hypothetical protein CR203_10070 [Salipaludibacillus neizhouensis]
MIRLGIFYFVLYCSFAVVLMFLPLYLQYHGIGTGRIGMIMAMGSVMAVIGQPIWGYISDKVNSAKKVLLFIMVSALLCSFLFFAVESFWSLLLLFTLFMFFMTSCGPLTDSIAMQYANKHKKNYGAVRSFGSIGVGTSALVLGMLIGVVGIQYIGWMYAIIMLAAIPLVLIINESGREVTTGVRPSITLSSLKELLKNKKYIWIVIISFLIFTPHKMNDSLLTIYLADLGALEKQIGLAWMFATFSSVPIFALTGLLLKRFKEMTLLMVAAFLYSIRWFLYGVWDDPQILTYLQLLHGVTFPLFFVAVFHYVTKLVPRELIATGQLLFIASTIGLGGLLGNAGGGWHMETYSPQATYHLAGYFSLIASILIMITLLYSRRNNKTKIYNGTRMTYEK